MSDDLPDPERADLLAILQRQRGFLRFAVRALDDGQARTRSTPSELTLGGLVKHLTATEAQWADFVVDGPGHEVDWASVDWSNPPAEVAAFQQAHRMGEDETLAGLLRAYDEQAARTDELVATTDLDATQPLPKAPWFEPGAVWSARRVVLHLIAETAQHCGHADIVREAIDAQKTMG